MKNVGSGGMIGTRTQITEFMTEHTTIYGRVPSRYLDSDSDRAGWFRRGLIKEDGDGGE
jgi:hypothetical protein